MNGLATFDRQPRETPKAWEAFGVYRDLGTGRTYREAAALLEKSESGLQKWGSRWHWQARIGDWQDEQDRIADHKRQQLERHVQEQEAAAVTKMISRHTRVAEAMTRIVGDKLNGFIKAKCETCGQGSTQLSPKDMAAWLATASKLERVCRGLPPEGDRAPLIQVNNLSISVQAVVLIGDAEARDLNARLLRRLSQIDRAKREQLAQAAKAAG